MRQAGYAQLILIGIVALAVAGGIWFVYEEGHDAGYGEAMAEIREIELEQKAKEASASVALETDRERTRTVYRTITREVDRVVERPVFLAACFDDDGLRIARAALAGALVPAGEPDRRVPAADAAGERPGPHGAPEAGRGR